MECASKPRARAKPLDLVRRAKALGVTPGHLSRVISGARESASLLLRLDQLIECESRKTTNATETHNPQN